MKKLIFILLILCMIPGLSSCKGGPFSGQTGRTSQAETSSKPDRFPDGVLTFRLNESGDGYFVTGCEGSASDRIEIPATHEGLPVVGIDGGAFYGCDRLKSMTIPASVTQIDFVGFPMGLTTIYYGGTQTQWFIMIGAYSSSVFNHPGVPNAIVYYESAG